MEAALGRPVLRRRALSKAATASGHIPGPGGLRV